MIDALLPKVKRDILAVLLTRPGEAFYQREIVRATGGGKGAVERELRTLTEAGILLREKRGNLTYYRANQDCPIYPELHGLMVKTAGVADVVREALSEIHGIRLAFIFGSMAKGTFDARSDIDLLVVADTSFADISGALRTAEDRLNREITPTVYSPQEFAEKLKAKHHFLTRVIEEPKIVLIGDEVDLERMGRPTP